VLASFFDPKTGSVKRRWRIPGDFPAKPEFARAPGGWLYLEPHFPPARLVIAGAGHVGRAVAHQAGRLGFETIVLDDRPELANRDRIPDAGRFIVGDIAAALGRIVLGGDAFVVIVTRGHRHDAEALRACIRRRTAYLGMIGSARKIALMKDDFLAKGWATPAQWARVHAPIGLPIGSRTVEEIAVSIAAELVAVRRGVRDRFDLPVIGHG
jgi:xanthine dehydrogenase accessory factor